MSKITDLTPAQWDQVYKLRTEWLTAGCSCEPADRPAAEAAVTEMYRLTSKPAPQFVWCDSPATANLAIWLLSSCARDSLRGSLWDSLGDSLRDSLGDSLRGSLGDSLWDSLGDSLGGSLWDSLWGSLGDSRYFWGQHEAYWVAYYDVPRRLGLVTYKPGDDAKLDLWVVLARACGWWWPYENICVISERPSVVRTETWDAARGTVRLHCADGPAMLFRDGWPVWAWHGRQVPEWVITSPAVEKIAAEGNVEVRRCAIEALGWDRFKTDAGLELVSACPDPGNPGFDLELYDVPERLWGSPVRVVLEWNGTPELDGTRRRFGTTVDVSCRTPLAAEAWTYDDPASPVRMTPELYATIQRRT